MVAIITLLLSMETPLRMPEILLTTPVNACILDIPIDTPLEFFLSYPFVNIQNDSIYFRGSSKVLLLKDGVPISSLEDVCFPSIERIEVLGEDASSIYGDYDGVINIITKRFSGERTYSNIKLIKSPDHTQFEFSRPFPKGVDLYLAGDLNSHTKISGNLGYKSSVANLTAYFDKEFLLKGKLFSNLKFSLLPASRDWSITQGFNIRNHKLLFGAEKDIGTLIQDYWEPYPLLYVVTGLRYNEALYPKISLGWIPRLDIIVFGSLTETQINIGLRLWDSSINLFKNDKEDGLEIRLVSPWIWGLKFIGAFTDDSQWTIMGEYKKEFKEGNLGLHILGDLASETVRFELKIIDAKIFYKLKMRSNLSMEPSYGLFWEFWD